MLSGPSVVSRPWPWQRNGLQKNKNRCMQLKSKIPNCYTVQTGMGGLIKDLFKKPQGKIFWCGIQGSNHSKSLVDLGWREVEWESLCFSFGMSPITACGFGACLDCCWYVGSEKVGGLYVPLQPMERCSVTVTTLKVTDHIYDIPVYPRPV